MMIDILEVVVGSLRKDQEQWNEVLLSVMDCMRSMQDDSVKEVQEKAKSVLEEWKEQI